MPKGSPISLTYSKALFCVAILLFWDLCSPRNQNNTLTLSLKANSHYLCTGGSWETHHLKSPIIYMPYVGYT